MREYDTTFIVHPAQTDAQIAGIAGRIEGLIGKYNGKVFYTKSLGKRTLAYPIQKQTKGTYICVDYTADGGVIPDIERTLRLDEGVMRFLTVEKNPDVDVEARVQEIAARGEDRSVAAASEVTETKQKPSDDESFRGDSGVDNNRE